MSSKKYRVNIEQTGDSWAAQIVRQVSKHKTHVSAEQTGFADQAEAQTWADGKLAEFIATQQTANTRQAEQRKESEEVKLQRSTRRAEKTEAAKLAQQQEQLDEELVDDSPLTSND